MEHARVAAAVRIVRSGTESDFAESQDGPGGSPAVRRGVCFVSRDAAREAPDAKVRVQSAVALAGISRGGEIVSGIREGAEGLGRAGTEEISIKFQAVRKLASGLRF